MAKTIHRVIITELELMNASDIDLLQEIVNITLRDGPLTPQDQAELDAINQEFLRRESL